MAGFRKTPELTASNQFKRQCHVVCSQFYDDKPDKSLVQACDIINKVLFKGAQPVQCKVKPGQDKFPTADVYLRDALLKGDIEVYDDDLPEYREFLGPLWPDFEKRIKNNEVQVLNKPYKPTTYQSYQGGKAEDGIIEFLKRQDPAFDLKKFKDLMLDTCGTPEYDEGTPSKKHLIIQQTLLEEGLVKRRVDANKIATDMMKFKGCKIKEE